MPEPDNNFDIEPSQQGMKQDAPQPNTDPAVHKTEIERREAALEQKEEGLVSRENSLKQLENELEARKADLKVKEAELVSRESSLNLLQNKIKELKDQNEAKHAEIIKKDADISWREIELKNGLPKQAEEVLAAAKQILKEQEDRISRERISLEEREAAVIERERQASEAESIRGNESAELRNQLNEELRNRRITEDARIDEHYNNRLAEIETKITTYKSGRFSQIEAELKTLRDSVNAELKHERKDFDQKMNTEREKLSKEKEEVQSLQVELERKQDDLGVKTKSAEGRKQLFEEKFSNLEQEVQVKVSERESSFKAEEQRLKDECERLRSSLTRSQEYFGVFEELKMKLGNKDAEDVLRELNGYEESVKDLKRELAERPTKAMQETYDRLKENCDRLENTLAYLSEENKRLKDERRDQDRLTHEIENLTAENIRLSQQKQLSESHNGKLTEDLKKFSAMYGSSEDRESRVSDIKKPYFTENLTRSQETSPNEIEWLENIHAACVDYGLRFPKRILYAFHTALKTAEWSPMTVLAGVSGTGKSELPRLYCHFGGLKYLNLAVQPNWDSQEAMLGFFNSIDNKFDAQPVLRFLCQTQEEKSETYPEGLQDVMNLILLDEMNLAHVELYFAEFLSKFELRRGKPKNDLPWLDVKLGAGIESYKLGLGRNVLWAGTMNQDETTKSLSDKVLDRGIIINFPRPKTLERRKKLKPLIAPANLLLKTAWNKWVRTESIFDDETIAPYKEFIEVINTHLAKVNKALGHRVLQSIEYYMANYPTVRNAYLEDNEELKRKEMKIAFEDQLVQKVMPKLRGIETRGRSKTECLDKIEGKLKEDYPKLVDDFNIACEAGYGQFMWSSANYIPEDTTEKENGAPENTINE